MVGERLPLGDESLDRYFSCGSISDIHHQDLYVRFQR